MRRRWWFPSCCAIALVASLAVPAVATSTGEGADETNGAVLSPLAISALDPPNPVLGADGNVHLVYELAIVNQSRSSVDFTSVDVLDADHPDTTLDSIDSATLQQVLALLAENDGTSFSPSSSGYLFVDTRLPSDADIPHTLLHHFTMSVTDSTGANPPQTIEFDGVSVPVGPRKAVVVAPPLRGSRWVVGNGCCNPPNAYRGATLSINGTVHVAERFAIDFVQLGSNGAIADGDPTKNESYGYFGDDVLAAAPGTVIALQDDQPEGTPGSLPAGQTVQTAGGNYVVIDIGRGRFAFDADLQPGSLTVKVGDTVKTGGVIGLLGNTGNSDAADLHFHIMDGPSPLLSNGLPFVFTSFTGEGRVTDEQALVGHEVAPVDASTGGGRHRRQMPLNLEVVDFGR